MAPALIASAEVLNAVLPSFAALSTMNLFEKSRPPVSRPIGGMMMSLTKEVIMEPKAAPMMTPTARSIALPLTANSLNSFHIRRGLRIQHDVDKLFGDDHDPSDCFTRDQSGDLLIS